MRSLVALCLGLALSSCGPEPLRMLVEHRDTIVWRGEVEIVRDEAARRRGLRDYAGLGAGQGLVLEAPVEDELCITNGPVSFAIDAAFADRDGVVVAVERAIGAGDTSMRCHRPARWILETAAGELEGIMPGDTFRGAGTW